MGSPPRGRGKVGHSVISTISSGITPAWAGKSLFDMVINSLLEDHPRVGGEKFQKPIDMLQDMGSPPRGRGKVLEFALVFRWCRITPAWAGKRMPGEGKAGRNQDHPRVGGEKSYPSICSKSRPGSPPRGRGKASLGSRLRTTRGITPAWAGKRSVFLRFRFYPRDHPRVGGEKSVLYHPGCTALGSPPRGRGKDISFAAMMSWRRITPAWAGKSGQPRHMGRHWQDHPRVGGEKGTRSPHAALTAGSPPRGRGKD